MPPDSSHQTPGGKGHAAHVKTRGVRKEECLGPGWQSWAMNPSLPSQRVQDLSFCTVKVKLSGLVLAIEGAAGTSTQPRDSQIPFKHHEPQCLICNTVIVHYVCIRVCDTEDQGTEE